MPGAAEAAPAATEVQPLTDEALAAFEAYIEATRELYNVPGYVAISPGDFLLMPFQFVEGEDGGITLVIAGAIEAPKIE